MAKKDITELPYLDDTLDNIMSDRFGIYTKYIIQERALPDARDGLKPVQRRILYSMWIDGNTVEKAHRKSAKTVGSVMGTFHPHGDSSIYEAMVRMSQDWKVNLPLIDMHGNNGSIDDDPAAAMRYTEARLSKNAALMLQDIDKNTVTMTNNYDDTCLEPTVLPARYPMLLVNGSTGIASGYATNIAPHNLNEIVNATIHRLNNPECSLDELLQYVKGPDFPTGGIVQGKDAIKDVFATGKGKVVLRSRCEIVEGKTNNQIIVTEIPYEVIKCQLVKKISDISLNKDVEGILDVRDESGRSGLKIVIDVRKETDANLILNYLYKSTDLQINYSYNSIAIVNHRPVLMSLTAAIDAFIEHRKQVVLNRSIFLRDKKKARLHVIEGLIKAISILDEVIELIRKSKDKRDAVLNLMKAFAFTEIQAEAIVNLRLYRLSNTDITQLKEEYASLIKEIAELERIINSAQILTEVLVKELKEVNELCPTPRKTTIEDEVTEIVVDKLAMIPNEDCYLSLSKDGYIKRYTPRAYSSNEGSLPFTKDGDFLIGVKDGETLDTLLVFTSKGNYLYLPLYKIEDGKFKDLGKHLSSYVKMEGNERVIGACLVKNFQTYAFVVLATKNGIIKKTSIPKFEVTKWGKELVAMKLKKNDEVVSMNICYEGSDLVIVTKNGYYNKYSSEILSDLATRAQGVLAISCKQDELVSVAVDNHDGNEMLLALDRGMKRIHFSELAFTNRAVKGIRIFKQIKTNPASVTASKVVGPYNSLYYKDKEYIKFDVKDIPFMDIEQSFSGTVSSNESYSLMKDDLSDIETVKIIDLPEDYNSLSDTGEFEEESLIPQEEVKSIEHTKEVQETPVIKKEEKKFEHTEEYTISLFEDL